MKRFGTTSHSRRSLLLLTGWIVLSLTLPFINGCKKEEEKSDPNYYTGPMKPKGSGGAPARGTNP